jgi:hypothetical protein
MISFIKKGVETKMRESQNIMNRQQESYAIAAPSAGILCWIFIAVSAPFKLVWCISEFISNHLPVISTVILVYVHFSGIVDTIKHPGIMFGTMFTPFMILGTVLTFSIGFIIIGFILWALTFAATVICTPGALIYDRAYRRISYARAVADRFSCTDHDAPAAEMRHDSTLKMDNGYTPRHAARK